jgi:hypothetical protein
MKNTADANIIEIDSIDPARMLSALLGVVSEDEPV